MANPRQRSKAKSHKHTKPSLHEKRRLHQKLRRAPPLKGPEVLQHGWDKKKTVFQNYAALGLLPSIPLPQGPSGSKSHRAKINLPSEDASSAIVGYGRIIRDDEGNVIDIILPEDDEVVDDGGFEMDTEELAPVEAKTAVVKELEKLASSSAPVIRHTSTSERTWLQLLVDKYADDYAAMSRDRKLNVWQKTQGEIKRAVSKAGGVEKLSRA